MSYRLTPAAEADIEGIADYIAEHNAPASVRLVEDFVRRWELLATQPYSGATREDILPSIRHLVMGQYIAFYRVDEDAEVLILRVIHGRRNITAEDVSS
jgi:toxin ParE1/3/4